MTSPPLDHRSVSAPPRWFLAALAGPAAILVVTILVLVLVEFGSGRSPALGDDAAAGATARVGADPLDATRRVTDLRSVITFDDGRTARIAVSLSAAEEQAFAVAEVVELVFDHRAGSGAVFEIAVTGGSQTTVDSRTSTSGDGRMTVDVRSLVGGFGVSAFDLTIRSSVPSISGRLLAEGQDAASVVLAGPSTESFSSLVLLELFDACADGDRVEAALSLDSVFAPIGELAEPGGYTPLALCWDPLGGSSLWRTRAAAGASLLRDPTALAYLDANRTGAAGGAFYSYRIAGGTVFVLSGECEVLVCGLGSPQQRWFDQSTTDLASGCVVAYWSGQLDPDLAQLVASRTDFAVPGSFARTGSLSETRAEISDGSIRWSRASTGPVSSGTTNCRRGS